MDRFTSKEIKMNFFSVSFLTALAAKINTLNMFTKMWQCTSCKVNTQ